MRRRFNAILRGILAASRWAMAPLCLGLAVALLIVPAQFFRELAHIVAGFPAMADGAIIVAVLKLVDLVLIANMVMMIVGAAVGVILPPPASAAERPEWAGFAAFGAIKLKLLAAVSAIAAIDLLESLLDLGAAPHEAIWEVAILLAFGATGVLLAVMDRLGAERH